MNDKILKKIAKKYGVTVEEVRRDMEYALDETYNKLNYGFMPASKKNKPTLEKFLTDAANRVRNENG